MAGAPSQVRDAVRGGVLAADLGDAGVGGLARLGEGVVARVEVLALLELVLEEVLLRGEFAVEAEEALFVGGEGLWVDARLVGWCLVALMLSVVVAVESGKRRVERMRG